MSYRLLFQKRTKQELDESLGNYGDDFRQHMEEWLEEIVEAATRKDHAFSADLMEILEAGLEAEPKGWWRAAKKWWSASLLEKIKAVVVAARKRCPPWELRAATRRFTALGAIPCEVMVVYEVDHVGKQVVVRKFEGLPGQG